MNKPTILPKEIDIKSTDAVVCEKCENDTFQPAVLMRKVSAFLTGTGKAGFYPIQTFACSKCGHANGEFVPEELKSKPTPAIKKVEFV